MEGIGAVKRRVEEARELYQKNKENLVEAEKQLGEVLGKRDKHQTGGGKRKLPSYSSRAESLTVLPAGEQNCAQKCIDKVQKDLKKGLDDIHSLEAQLRELGVDREPPASTGGSQPQQLRVPDGLAEEGHPTSSTKDGVDGGVGNRNSKGSEDGVTSVGEQGMGNGSSSEGAGGGGVAGSPVIEVDEHRVDSRELSLKND